MTGDLVGGSDHLKKGRDLNKSLNKLLKRVNSAHSLTDSQKSCLIAKLTPYIEKLQKAINMKQQTPLTGKTI